jgi:hypothetical protein
VQCEGVLTLHQCIVCGLENIFHEVTKVCGLCSVRQSREMQYFQPAADVRDAKFMSPAANYRLCLQILTHVVQMSPE